MNRQEYLKSVTNNSKHICFYCGILFKPKASNRIKFCSRACYYANKTKARQERLRKEQIERHQEKVCKICGKPFIPLMRSDTIYCSDECIKVQRSNDTFKKNSARKIIKERECKQCQKIFIPGYGDKRQDFCSKECMKSYHTFHNYKERAEFYGVLYEEINIYNVFTLYDWTCQLCGIATPRINRGENLPDSPELDHIIPMSKGGNHLYSNVQLLCRQCNIKKSNKIQIMNHYSKK